LTLAGVGAGKVALATAFTEGQVVSKAVLTPGGETVIGVGAMSASFAGATLDYRATALFDFSASREIYLNLLSDTPPTVSGPAFDSLELQVSVNGGAPTAHTFSSLTAAEHFFTNDPLLAIAPGSRSVLLTYDLIYNPPTLAQLGDGFGFSYDFATTPVAAPLTATAFDFAVARPSPGIPEPSTWVMMLLGFAGLGYAGMRRSYWQARGGIGLAI
jgi:hypothetical protein